MTTWLYIGRFNPPHKWHISIIDRVLKENKKTILFIWTKKTLDSNNPIDYSWVKKLLSHKYHLDNNINIFELKDDSSDLIWIYSIYKILFENSTPDKKINIYCWDFSNDSAYITIKKYEHIFSEYTLNFIEQDREKSFIEKGSQKIFISWTNFRKALNDKNFDLAKDFSDSDLYEEIKKYFL